jgi:nucleoside-diphosphate-sugar epimerase
VPATINAGVDVRDVAELIRYAAEHPDDTNGERYIANGFRSHPQAIADTLREELKNDKKALERIAVGKPGEGYGDEVWNKEVQINAEKGRAVLEKGEWIQLKESIVDTVKMFEGLV